MEQLVEKSPPQIRRRGARARYPWQTIQPGQAFKFAEGVGMASASSMAYAQAGSFSIKLVVRKEADGIWCYRVDGMPDEPKNANFREVVTAGAREPAKQGEALIMGQDIDERRHEWSDAGDEI